MACRMAMSSQSARRVFERNGYFSKEGTAPSSGSSLNGQGKAGVPGSVVRDQGNVEPRL